MGKPRFSKIAKFFALALLGVATAMAAIAVLSSPATADPSGGGGGDSDDYPWDTDNLRYGSYNAKSFNIPFHKYDGYSGVSACQSAVADGFFQSGDGSDDDVPEDFPVLVFSDSKWSVAPETSTANNSGCDRFVAQQDRLAGQVVAGVGYALDESGNLAVAPSGAAYTTGRSAVDLNYVSWISKGWGYTLTKADNFQTINTIGATSDGSYLRRVDGRPAPAKPRAISPDTAEWTVPSAESSRTGNFGASWHGTKLITTVTVPSYYDSDLDRWVEDSTVTRFSDVRVSSHGNLSRHLTAAKSADLCPSLFHPRGEDSVNRIGGSTGRTLSGLSHANGQIADRYWCRSDLRYLRSFKAEHHTSLGQNVIRHTDAVSAGSVFTAYGRLNCYYTSTSITALGNGGYRCVYMFPLPQCTDNGTKRNFTKEELDGYTTGQSFTAADDGSTSCTAALTPEPATPPQAGFTADACVTASLEIYENRTAGSDAEPGVTAADRTLAVSAGRTAWDLDITSPHPLTASPPRDATAGTGDADGCADGSENRADHAASSGDAARSQATAPSYASSARTDSAAPPNDADGDIDYTGAVKNMAHRYASRVTENTCAAKRAEAEAELALLEAREDAFTRWLSDYRTSANTNASRMGGYTRAAVQSGSGLAVLWFNDAEAAKASYAGRLRSRYSALSSALAAAKTAYDRTTDRTAGSSRAAVIAGSDSGCVSHYTGETGRLKTLFTAAETAALGNGTSGISEERTAVSATRLTIPAYPVTVPNTNSYTRPDISAVESRRESSTICLDFEIFGGCWRAAEPGETCGGTQNCHGRTRVVITRYYTCPGGSYTVSGTVSGSYKTHRRSRSFSATYTAAARTTESTSTACPGLIVQTGSTFASDARAYVLGTANTGSVLPSTVGVPAVPAALGTLDKVSLLGSYHPSHADRTNLTATSASDRAAAGSLTLAVGTVPAGSPQKITDYQTAYKTAYDNAYTQATTDMGTTATTSTWNRFDWRYQTSTLAWGSYQEDPAVTYSDWVPQAGETEADRDGTGCDLINVAADGGVSVEATRLDYETSSYGKGTVFGTRTDAQRTCKIRRTRTPELLLEYQPSAPSGTDTPKAAAFWYVNYQPTSLSERFKLYDEAEVFAVKASLADRAPVLCYQPGEELWINSESVDLIYLVRPYSNGPSCHPKLMA